MPTVDRIQRLLADYAHRHEHYTHTHEHAAWWELGVYVCTALLVGFALASVFSFALPRGMPGF